MGNLLGNLRGPLYLCDQGAVTSTPPIILAQNLGLVLGEGDACVTVLKAIDLTVMPGETLALLGPSGSGKSSLLAVLAGLERAGSGTLQVGGQDFSALDEDGLATARRGRIGVVLQAFHLLPTMTAQENVATPLDLAGVEGAMARAHDELVAVGLGHRLGHYPAQLSGGEQQRVAIARALVGQPDILILDEPTASLDGDTGRNIIDFVRREVLTPERCILIITHDARIYEFADRIMTMEDGRVTRIAPGGAATTSPSAQDPERVP